MKKIIQFVTSTFAVLTLLLVPVAVHAQDATPIEVGGDSSTTATPTTTTSPTTATTTTTAGTPDTGIAPKGHRVTSNVAVFAAGSVLGAAIGFGIITIRNKQSDE